MDLDEEEEEGQFEDIQTYLDHHNTYQESQNIARSIQRDYWTWMMTGT